jgi:hypothetical protein
VVTTLKNFPESYANSISQRSATFSEFKGLIERSGPRKCPANIKNLPMARHGNKRTNSLGRFENFAGWAWKRTRREYRRKWRSAASSLQRACSRYRERRTKAASPPIPGKEAKTSPADRRKHQPFMHPGAQRPGQLIRSPRRRGRAASAEFRTRCVWRSSG